MTQAEHHPDPDYVARLEGQLTTEYRRLERLGDSYRWRPTFGRWLRAAVYVLSGLLLGAASVTMAQRAGEADRIELLQRQAGLKVSLAERELELNQQVFDVVTAHVAAGTMTPSAMLSAQAALVESETRLTLASLDVEEIDASGGPVRNEISAPRVGGRDFFSERLQIELDMIAARGPALGEMINLTQARVRAGVTTSESIRSLTTESLLLAAEGELIRETLALRQSFLDGDMDAAEAEIRHRLLLATSRRQIAEAELADLRAESARVREAFEVGTVAEDVFVATQRDLLQAEADVQMAEVEVQLIEQELVR